MTNLFGLPVMILPHPMPLHKKIPVVGHMGGEVTNCHSMSFALASTIEIKISLFLDVSQGTQGFP